MVTFNHAFNKVTIYSHTKWDECDKSQTNVTVFQECFNWSHALYSRWLRILGVNRFSRDQEKTLPSGDCLHMQISHGRPPPASPANFS